MSDEINPYNAEMRVPSGCPFAPLPGEVSEVVYELEVEDLVERAMHNQRQSRALRRRQLLAILLLTLVVAGLSLVMVSVQGASPFLATFVFILTFLLFFALAPGLSRRGSRRILRKVFLEGSNRSLLGTQRLSIAPRGLIQASEVIETFVKWAAVERIETNEEYAYFFIAALQAYIVPRRAFNDDLQFRSFVELARRYWRQATATSPPLERRPG